MAYFSGILGGCFNLTMKQPPNNNTINFRKSILSDYRVTFIFPEEVETI